MRRNDNRKSAIAEEFLRTRFWVLLAASLFFLFLSTTWETYEVQFAEEQAQHSGTDKDRVLPIFTSKPYIELFRELGFGCLIALVLIVFVEKSAREEQAFSVEKQRAAISENVFKGVFSLRTPSEIVEAVSNQVFKAKVIREHHKNDYHFTEIPTDGQADADFLKRFLKVDITADYMLRNISDEEISIPIRLGFPVPPLPRFSSFVKVHKISIGGQELTAVQIAEGDRSAEDPPARIRYAWCRKAAANATIHVVANYTLIKERSDNEVWQTLYPGRGMELTANINVQGLEFGVHPLHEKNLIKLSGVGDTGTHRWVLDGPVLPHQGMIIWWRPKENPNGAVTQNGSMSQSKAAGGCILHPLDPYS
ncbi:MAG: hypothetical protein MN733_21670 [Nitrososphaera sp.]|nr:hypothetical protein [Nitrososphaera sp.]